MINLQFTPDWPVRCVFKFIAEAFQGQASFYQLVPSYARNSLPAQPRHVTGSQVLDQRSQRCLFKVPTTFQEHHFPSLPPRSQSTSKC